MKIPMDLFAFDVDYFRRGLEMVNPGVPFFILSCRTGQGVEAWLAWLLDNQGVDHC